jgi:multiple sugar transport system substrate-binding protein
MRGRSKLGLLATGASVLAIAACGGGDESDQGSAATDGAGNVTGTVVFWQFDSADTFVTAWKAAIADFEKQNPGIDVKMEIVPWDGALQKLTTAAATNATPDVSMLGNNVVAQFQALDALEPLDPYIAQWSQEAGEDVTKDYWPGDELYYRLDGKWWGAPMFDETRALYYRKDLFKKAGLTPPRTWEEMVAAARKLTTGGVYGWGLPQGKAFETLQTFAPVYLAYGARMLRDGKCGFETPEFYEALELYTSVYKEKLTPPDSPNYNGADLENQMRAGKLAMLISGPWFHAQLKEDAPDMLAKLGIAELPSGPAGQFAFLGGVPLVMWKSTEHKDAAAKWIEYATSPEGSVEKFATIAGVLPGRKSLTEDAPWTSAPLETFPRQMEVAQAYQYPEPEIPQMASIEVDTIQTAVQKVAVGEATPEAATAELCDKIDTALSR